MSLNIMRLATWNLMDMESEYYLVTICFPAFIFALILAYLYLKDRNKLR